MHFKYAVKPSGEQFYIKQILLSLCNAFQLNGMRFGTFQCVLMQLDAMRLIAMHVSCIEVRFVCLFVGSFVYMFVRNLASPFNTTQFTKKVKI